MSKKFTYQWKIENYTMTGVNRNVQKHLSSPTFTIPVLDNSEWYLHIRHGYDGYDYVELRKNSSGPSIKAKYSLSIGGIGWPQSLKQSYCTCKETQTFGVPSHDWDDGYSIYSLKRVILNETEYFNNVKQDTIPDILIIECCLWPSDSQTYIIPTSPYSVFLSTCTVFSVENRNFFLPLKNFSAIPEGLMVCANAVSGCNSSLEFNYELLKGSCNESEQLLALNVKRESPITTKFVVKNAYYLVDAQKKYHELNSGVILFNKEKSVFYKLRAKIKDMCLNDDVLLFFKVAVSEETPVSFVQSRMYDTSDLPIVKHNVSWRFCLDQKFNENRFGFRLLAILIIILSVILHIFKESIFGTVAV